MSNHMRQRPASQVTLIGSPPSNVKGPSEEPKKELQAGSGSSYDRVDSLGSEDTVCEEEQAVWRSPSWGASLKAIVSSSWLNVLLVFVPLSWTAHFLELDIRIEFIFSFLAVIPLEKLFELGGEEMATHLGKSIGDLVITTLHNAVEVTLAIMLLVKCELRLLQSTVIGVVLLNMLLIPGMAFLTGGTKIWQQHLAETPTQLNQSLLMIGVMSLVIPLAFLTGIRDQAEELLDIGDATAGSRVSSGTGRRLLDRRVALVGRSAAANAQLPPQAIISDTLKNDFLTMSYGVAFVLLLVYISSRIYLHNPPGDPEEHIVRRQETLEKFPELRKHHEREPRLNLGSCILLLVVSVALMTVSAEWLVDSVDPIQQTYNFSDAFFGMVILPLTAYSADALITIAYFLRSVFFMAPQPPEELAKGRAIDMSVQFLLLWLPLMVLLAWPLGKPLSLLFDVFEVAVVVAATFMVNYVTQDSRTNWAEGWLLVSFYAIIVVAAWLYSGQTHLKQVLLCANQL